MTDRAGRTCFAPRSCLKIFPIDRAARQQLYNTCKLAVRWRAPDIARRSRARLYIYCVWDSPHTNTHTSEDWPRGADLPSRRTNFILVLAFFFLFCCLTPLCVRHSSRTSLLFARIRFAPVYINAIAHIDVASTPCCLFFSFFFFC